MEEVTGKHIQIDSVIIATYAAKLIVLVVQKCRKKNQKKKLLGNDQNHIDLKNRKIN